MDSFHIANADLVERKYHFFYEGDSLIISEEIGKKKHGKKKFNIEDNFGLVSIKTSFNSDNGLSPIQNMNFNAKNGLKNKNQIISLAQSTHDLSIKKILLMHDNDQQFLISFGKDNIIKIWK